jgi:hypothetical protein
VCMLCMYVCMYVCMYELNLHQKHVQAMADALQQWPKDGE